MQPLRGIEKIQNDWAAFFPVDENVDRRPIIKFFDILKNTKWNRSRENNPTINKHDIKTGTLRIYNELKKGNYPLFKSKINIESLLIRSIEDQTKPGSDIRPMAIELYKRFLNIKLIDNAEIIISFKDEILYKISYLTKAFPNITKENATLIVDSELTEKEENSIIQFIQDSKQPVSNNELKKIIKREEDIPEAVGQPQEEIIDIRDLSKQALEDPEYKTPMDLSKDYVNDIRDLIPILTDNKEKLIEAGLGSYDTFVNMLSSSQNKAELLRLYIDRINKAFTSGNLSVELYNAFMEIINRYKYEISKYCNAKFHTLYYKIYWS